MGRVKEKIVSRIPNKLELLKPSIRTQTLKIIKSLFKRKRFHVPTCHGRVNQLVNQLV